MDIHKTFNVAADIAAFTGSYLLLNINITPRVEEEVWVEAVKIVGSFIIAVLANITVKSFKPKPKQDAISGKGK
jgi:hypothetical protein